MIECFSRRETLVSVVVCGHNCGHVTLFAKLSQPVFFIMHGRTFLIYVLLFYLWIWIRIRRIQINKSTLHAAFDGLQRVLKEL
jgi:hypothetical protein